MGWRAHDIELRYDLLVMILSTSTICRRRPNARGVSHPPYATAAAKYGIRLRADMCVLLSYYKMQDDWNDEHKLKALIAKALLAEGEACGCCPEKAAFIEKKMNMLTIVESARNLPLDKVAKVFGDPRGGLCLSR